MNFETRALERGVERKRLLVQHAGGCLLTREAAELLAVSVSAVDERREDRSFLAVPLAPGEWGYPARQFINGEVRKGVADVVRAAGDLDPWVLLSILLDSVDDGPTLLDRLDEPAVKADALNRVRTFGQHVAA